MPEPSAPPPMPRPLIKPRREKGVLTREPGFFGTSGSFLEFTRHLPFVPYGSEPARGLGLNRDNYNIGEEAAVKRTVGAWGRGPEASSGSFGNFCIRDGLG